MKKFILLNLGAFTYLIYRILYLKSDTNKYTVIPRHEYFSLLCPILLSISAGLFLKNKTKSAAIVGLIGTSIIAKDIFSYWLMVDLILKTKYVLQFYIFVTLSTGFVAVLGTMIIKTFLNSKLDPDFQVTNSRSNDISLRLMAVIPTALVVIATIYAITWIVLNSS
jgi:uncharacterized protein involved in response to NO